jgi:hypothetical protein
MNIRYAFVCNYFVFVLMNGYFYSSLHLYFRSNFLNEHFTFVGTGYDSTNFVLC